MLKNQLINIVLFILFISCQTPRHLLVKNGKWELETENDFMIIRDTLTREKYYYHAIALGRHIYGRLPSELFSLPTFSAEVRNKDLKVSELDNFTKSVLKKVDFNIQADTLYFIIRGNLIVFSSPYFERKKATNIISLQNEYYDGSIMDPPIRALYEDDMSWNDNDIFRIIYYNPWRKYYLIKDCFRVKDSYLYFVYIFQSRTRKNDDTEPREWRTMWDVTSPQHIFHSIYLLKTANALSVKNRLAN